MRRLSAPRTRAAATLLAALVSLSAVATRAAAQRGYFGQNKIQYRDFDWHVLQGEHVDVYYYPAAEGIARMALSYAEESYDTLSRRFNHKVDARVPLIVYAFVRWTQGRWTGRPWEPSDRSLTIGSAAVVVLLVVFTVVRNTPAGSWLAP